MSDRAAMLPAHRSLSSHDAGRIVPAATLAVLAALLFCRRAWHALWFANFIDETEHIVGGRVLLAGGILYRDFVDQHGPLPYVLAEISGLVPALPQPAAARGLMLLLMLAAIVAVAASPGVRGTWERLCAVALFVGLGTSLWIVHVLGMLTYQPIAGMLLVIGCAQFTFCTWCGAPPRRAGLVAAGAAFALVPFAAYSYAPAALLLVASGIVAEAQRKILRALLTGAAGALLIMGGWMLLTSDLGGYLAFHFVANQIYFAPYQHFSLSGIPYSFLPHAAPDKIAHTAAAGVCVLGFLAIALPGAAAGGWRRAAALGIGLLGIAFSNPRASASFQDGAFVLLGFALAALAWSRLPRATGAPITAWTQAGWVAAFALAILGMELAGRAAVTAPYFMPRTTLASLPPTSLALSHEVWAQRVRQAVPPGEPMLALPFEPEIYIRAGRLPMPGFDHYLPWDADYARHLWFGRGHDLCAALLQAPPPVIYDNDWVVWNRYAPKDYMPCVGVLLGQAYQKMSDWPAIYVRKDRVAAWKRQ